jgi:hypothetical protein
MSWIGGKTDTRRSLLERMPKNSVCAEIGVYKGDFSAQILEVARPAVLHLIDPWKFEEEETYSKSWYGGTTGGSQQKMDSIYESVWNRFRREAESGIISVHRAASADAVKGFADDYFDWIYIDGNHLYEFVKQDLELFYPKVKAGGYITGDDYQRGGWWQGGVKKAVDEFTSNGLGEVVRIANGQFILKKAAAHSAAGFRPPRAESHFARILQRMRMNVEKLRQIGGTSGGQEGKGTHSL